jgi:hypothetical protein
VTKRYFAKFNPDGRGARLYVNRAPEAPYVEMTPRLWKKVAGFPPEFWKFEKDRVDVMLMPVVKTRKLESPLPVLIIPPAPSSVVPELHFSDPDEPKPKPAPEADDHTVAWLMLAGSLSAALAAALYAFASGAL